MRPTRRPRRTLRSVFAANQAARRARGDAGASHRGKNIEHINVVSLNCGGVAASQQESYFLDFGWQWDVQLLQEFNTTEEGFCKEILGHFVISAPADGGVWGCAIAVHRNYKLNVHEEQPSTCHRLQRLHARLSGRNFFFISAYLPQQASQECFDTYFRAAMDEVDAGLQQGEVLCMGTDANCEVGDRDRR